MLSVVPVPFSKPVWLHYTFVLLIFNIFYIKSPNSIFTELNNVDGPPRYHIWVGTRKVGIWYNSEAEPIKIALHPGNAEPDADQRARFTFEKYLHWETGLYFVVEQMTDGYIAAIHNEYSFNSNISTNYRS